MRVHEDHGVVGRAAPKRGGARVEHALRWICCGSPLPGVITEIVDEEIPRHARIFRCKWMKVRNLVLVGELGLELIARIAAGFQQQDLHSGFREARGNRSAPGAGADHDVVVVIIRRWGHGQNVLMNSISAFLSSSLSGVSFPNAFSSAVNPSVSLNFAVPK